MCILSGQCAASKIGNSHCLSWAVTRQNQQNDFCGHRRLRPAWESAQSDQSSLSAWRIIGSLATHKGHSKDSDQTGRMPRLIWVFAGHRSMLFCWFCCVAAQFMNHLPSQKSIPDLRCVCVYIYVCACVGTCVRAPCHGHFHIIWGYGVLLDPLHWLFSPITTNAARNRNSHPCIVNVLKNWSELHVSICNLRWQGHHIVW